MVSLKEKVAYALGDAAAGGIVWKVMSIAFPLFFTNVFGLSFADAAVLMLVAAAPSGALREAKVLVRIWARLPA